MSEWKEYTGAPEQIEEIVSSGTDVLCRYQNGTERFKSEMFIGDWKHKSLTEYLICNHHPLADMICQQARTGQDVFVHIAGTIYANYIAHRAAQDMDYFHSYYNKKLEATTYITKKPNWHIPGAQYSFTRFGGYRANK